MRASVSNHSHYVKPSLGDLPEKGNSYGIKISEIQRKLGHKNIATTSLYLQALTNEENPYAEAIESAIGVVEHGES